MLNQAQKITQMKVNLSPNHDPSKMGQLWVMGGVKWVGATHMGPLQGLVVGQAKLP